ncbi:MAG: flavodoxin family protein [Desulfobacteraceae bacterium]|nr:flavodoxin family protein [Desulfobacteraceae bacterium]
MKTVCVLGSPREKGISTAIANQFCAAAESMGSEVRTFFLNKLRYSGCQACMACKKTHERCALEDDLTPVLDAIADADLLLLASPVYFGNVSSQLKGFIDRTYSFFVPDFVTNPKPCRLKPGKKVVFVLSQGMPDETAFANIYPWYEFVFLQRFGFSESRLIRACGVRDISKRQDLLGLAENTARELCRLG